MGAALAGGITTGLGVGAAVGACVGAWVCAFVGALVEGGVVVTEGTTELALLTAKAISEEE